MIQQSHQQQSTSTACQPQFNGHDDSQIVEPVPSTSTVDHSDSDQALIQQKNKLKFQIENMGNVMKCCTDAVALMVIVIVVVANWRVGLRKALVSPRSESSSVTLLVNRVSSFNLVFDTRLRRLLTLFTARF